MKKYQRIFVSWLVVAFVGIGINMVPLSQPAYGKVVKLSQSRPSGKKPSPAIPKDLPTAGSIKFFVVPGDAQNVSPAASAEKGYYEEVESANLRTLQLENASQLNNATAVSVAKTSAVQTSAVSLQAEVAAPNAVGQESALLATLASPDSRALILYDAPAGVPYSKLGKVYAIMLRNLLGHFKFEVVLCPIESYAAGDAEAYQAIFYLGSYYDNSIPAAFLSDVVNTQKTVVWFKYNIWKLAWDSSLGFQQRFGLSFTGLQGLNAAPSATNPKPGFFDTIIYKNTSLEKYYSYNATTQTVMADPDVGVMQITDPLLAQAVVPVKNSVTQAQIPYIIRSGNFWYVADLPFSFIGPRDRYLVICDILHDILAVNHAESHKAMVRFEDVSAKVTLSTIKTLSNFLYTKKIPFSIAVIPIYKDPLGKYNNGVPQEIRFAKATALLNSLIYAIPRGGTIVMHGLTHQYAAQLNPWSGVSADDFEFWNTVANSPVAEDSVAWAQARMTQGLAELKGKNYTPFTFETPHYQGSPNSYIAAASVFNSRYERAYYYTSNTPQLNLDTNNPGRDFTAGQFFPYIIYADYYGQLVLPENLGNIEYDIHTVDPSSSITYTWNDVYTNAVYARLVRDGYASFFFHPFWLETALKVPGYKDFVSLVNGITKLGYQWVGGKAELDAAIAASASTP